MRAISTVSAHRVKHLQRQTDDKGWTPAEPERLSSRQCGAVVFDWLAGARSWRPARLGVSTATVPKAAKTSSQLKKSLLNAIARHTLNVDLAWGFRTLCVWFQHSSNYRAIKSSILPRDQ
eukprot:3125658-Prymnesium_polylepis.1